MKDKVDPVRKLTYGPVSSRRLGKSLGINLMPSHIKVCPFDCVYCHCGCSDDITVDLNDYMDRLPRFYHVGEALEAKLKELKEADYPLKYITFSGNGEGSLHPDFDKIVDVVRSLRDKYYPVVKTCILSNSTTLHLPHSFRGIKKLDRKIMKLDAGSEEMFNLVNRPAPGITFRKIVEGLKRLEDYSLQTNFFTGAVSNSDEKSVMDWIETVKEIRPSEILLYTVARPTTEAGIKKISSEILKRIGEKAERETGIETYIY